MSKKDIRESLGSKVFHRIEKWEKHLSQNHGTSKAEDYFEAEAIEFLTKELFKDEKIESCRRNNNLDDPPDYAIFINSSEKPIGVEVTTCLNENGQRDFNEIYKFMKYLKCKLFQKSYGGVYGVFPNSFKKIFSELTANQIKQEREYLSNDVISKLSKIPNIKDGHTISVKFGEEEFDVVLQDLSHELTNEMKGIFWWICDLDSGVVEHDSEEIRGKIINQVNIKSEKKIINESKYGSL